MKKKIAAVLLTVTVSLMLTGCTGEKEEEKGVLVFYQADVGHSI